jgi:hypothetical protein
LWLAAGLSLVAGIVHLMVSPEYLNEWWGYGFFFILAGLAQLAYGLALCMQPWAYDPTGAFHRGPRPGARALFQAGAVGNAAIIGLYTLTRTVGIPFLGPEAGTVEAITAVSLITTAAELILVIILLRLARSSRYTVSN